MDRLVTEFDSDLDDNSYHTYDELLGTLCMLDLISHEEWDKTYDHLDASDLIRMFGIDVVYSDVWRR